MSCDIVQHLGSLLAAPDTSVVLNALQTLVAFVRKTHSSSSRLQASAGINNRLLALCHGWGGKEQVWPSLQHQAQTSLGVQINCPSFASSMQDDDRGQECTSRANALHDSFCSMRETSTGL